ncbi:hypothetical protein FDECE_6083 [Fusarium decemcellulare]|nr:hypothetical protein FDECE_6083 [Fusarium decemcellulare]
MTPNRNHPNKAQLPRPVDVAEPMTRMVENRNTMPVVEIWVGFMKRGRSFLDKLPLAPNTEQQIRALQEYHRQKFTAFEHFTLKWILCKSPIVLVAELCAAQSNDLEAHYFPREVQFENLEKSRELTGGFLRPETLRENTRLFHDSSSFSVHSPDGPRMRKVVCVGHVVEKKNLIWPLAFSSCLSFVAAAVAAVVAHNIPAGAGIGGIVGAATVLLWSYIMWLLK